MLILEFSTHNFCHLPGIVTDCHSTRQWMSGTVSTSVLMDSISGLMTRDYPAEPYKTSLISWFRIHCSLPVVTLLTECKNAAKHWKTDSCRKGQWAAIWRCPANSTLSRKKNLSLNSSIINVTCSAFQKKKACSDMSLKPDTINTANFQTHIKGQFSWFAWEHSQALLHAAWTD